MSCYAHKVDNDKTLLSLAVGPARKRRRRNMEEDGGTLKGGEGLLAEDDQEGFARTRYCRIDVY